VGFDLVLVLVETAGIGQSDSEIVDLVDFPVFVERLLERGALGDGSRKISSNRQPGRCCLEGCVVPLPERPVLTLHTKKA